MRKIFLKICVLFSVVALLVSCDKEDQSIEVYKLPTLAQTFLNENFTTTGIVSVMKDQDLVSGDEYEVMLQNGIEIKFDQNGDWKEIEAKNKTVGIPTSFILPNIVDYVNANYSSLSINSIEKNRNMYEIELTNGLDLVFNLEGEFIRLDK